MTSFSEHMQHVVITSVALGLAVGAMLGFAVTQFRIAEDCKTLEAFRIGGERYACVLVTDDKPAKPKPATLT